MIEKTLAKRYASALLAVTNREGTVDETSATLHALKSAYLGDARFRAVLHSPKVRKADKRALMRRALAAASRSVQEFADLLVEKNRAALLANVSDMYDHLADEFKSIVRVRVSTAFPLTPAEQGRLKSALDRVTGKACVLQTEVNRALKGGMLVRMGDEVVDGTVANRLKALRDRLHELQKR